ncbi:MAG: UDP-N-acetylmuramate dehydrogenase [Clostridia bacterium]|nr:UDP-N-acetylmuramate dehydrogenase [Clostridia bacterium]MDQ7791457.1 UDP-N-acetylmuramate dehydrogenase [Clostridia bacterium]
MAILRDLQARLSGRVRSSVSLSKHTTWRVGGPAEILVEPTGIEDLRLVLQYARERGIPLTVVGNGSNLLISDQGLNGIVVKLGSEMSRIEIGEGFIEVEAGAKLANILAAAREAGCGGLEFMAGIPASVGGAVAMNAGANGSSIGDRVLEATVVDLDGKIHLRSHDELGFGYRTCALQDTPAIVVSVKFGCFPKSAAAIRAEVEQYLARRKQTQPLEYPSAGSVFRNPPGGAAGRLIELAGAKGMRIGDAEVSRKHANFIVNLGAAKSRDIRQLMLQVQKLVNEHTGIWLEPEVKLLGKHEAIE